MSENKYILEIEFDDKTRFFAVTEDAFDCVCNYIEAQIDGDDDAREIAIIDAISRNLIPNKSINHYLNNLETFENIFKNHIQEISENQTTEWVRYKTYNFAE